jgi:tetratricopeptide (TPR) repeat protein
MAFCTNCGIQLKEDAKFCENCGQAVPTAEIQPIVDPVAELAKRRPRRFFGKVVVAVLAVALAVAIVFTVAPLILTAVASAYYNKGDWDQAITDFNQAIGGGASDANTYYYRGAAHLEKEDWDHAISDFSEALEQNSDISDVYYYRGTAYLERDDWDHAVNDFSKAIERDPNNANAYYYRGYAYFYGPKFEYDYDSLSPTQKVFVDFLGLLLNSHDSAIEDFESAIRINPNHTLAREMLKIAQGQ